MLFKRANKHTILAATAILLITIAAISLFFLTKASRPEKPPPSHTIDLVIARYKEPIDWLKDYDDYLFRRIYVYNKSGEPLECPSLKADCRVEPLPNVGVCDHTYLYHIIKHYNDPTAADMTIFLPASATANDMKKDKIGKILDFARGGEPTISGYRSHPDPKDDWLGGPTFQMDKHVLADHRNREKGDDFKLVKATPRPYGEWFKRYFPGEQPKQVSLLGMFAVSQEMIRMSPLSRYQSLIATLDRDKFPEAAHYMERSWAHLFKTIPDENLV